MKGFIADGGESKEREKLSAKRRETREEHCGKILSLYVGGWGVKRNIYSGANRSECCHGKSVVV